MITTKYLYPPGWESVDLDSDANPYAGAKTYSIQLMADSEIAETDATKVVKSILRTISKTVPQRLKIEKIRYDIRGFSNVSLRYDDDEETPIANLGAGQGVLCFSTGILSQLSTGDSTGDVLLSSVLDGSGELGYYTVIIDFEVKD